MGEHRPSKIQPNMVNCLALRLVDGHGKAKPYWELSPSELEGHLLFCGVVIDPWDKNLVPFMVPSNQLQPPRPCAYIL